MTVLTENNTFEIVFVPFRDVPRHGLEIIPRTFTRRSPVERPVRICRRNVNTRCYHERGKAPQIGKRIKFRPASQTNRGPSQQEKWHVAAECCGQLHQFLDSQWLFEQYRQGQQYRSRIAGTTTQAAAKRYSFFQNEPNPGRFTSSGKNAIRRFFNDITRNINV